MVVEGVNSTLVRLIWEFVLGPDESVLAVTFDRQKPGESMRTLIASRYGNTPFTITRVKFANKYGALLPATLVLLNVNKNEEFLYSLRVTYSRNAFVAQVNSQVAVIVHGKSCPLCYRLCEEIQLRNKPNHLIFEFSWNRLPLPRPKYPIF